MGIQVEFNPDLALRNIQEYKKGSRSLEECIPENLEENVIYSFLKKGQRFYWLHGEIPLLETKGEGQLSRPVASVRILTVTHFFRDGHPDDVYTKGKYLVKEVYDKDDPAIHFEGFAKVTKDS
jgi:hypothetical protein